MQALFPDRGASAPHVIASCSWLSGRLRMHIEVAVVPEQVLGGFQKAFPSGAVHHRQILVILTFLVEGLQSGLHCRVVTFRFGQPDFRDSLFIVHVNPHFRSSPFLQYFPMCFWLFSGVPFRSLTIVLLLWIYPPISMDSFTGYTGCCGFKARSLFHSGYEIVGSCMISEIFGFVCEPIVHILGTERSQRRGHIAFFLSLRPFFRLYLLLLFLSNYKHITIL